MPPWKVLHARSWLLTLGPPINSVPRELNKRGLLKNNPFPHHAASWDSPHLRAGLEPDG